MQNVVGHAERVGQRRGAIDRRQETLVGDGDDCVHALAELFEPSLSLQGALSAFELERLGHHRHRQRAELARKAGNDRRCAGARASAEPGGHEHHVCIVQRPDKLFGVFESRLAADPGIGPGHPAPW